jgi:hypothetical protein
MAPLAAGHLPFQRFVSCASPFAAQVDDWRCGLHGAQARAQAPPESHHLLHSNLPPPAAGVASAIAKPQ